MIENFRVMIIGWFYYGAVFMLGSIIVTAILNKVFNKLYIPPLIINAVSIILLFVGIRLNMKNMTYAMYFNYIPTVMASIFYNSIIFIVRKIQKRADVNC